jgi:hypothetical protein
VIRCKKARPKDAAALARISERAFHSDIHCGAPGLGGPPGYKSDECWNRRTRHFYKKVGFVEVGTDGRGGILFEKRISARGPGGGR